MARQRTGNVSPLAIYHVKKISRRLSPWFGRISIRQWLMVFVVFTIISFFYYNELIPTQFHKWIRIPPKVKFYCFRVESGKQIEKYENLLISNRISEDGRGRSVPPNSKVLLFVETLYSKLGRQLIETLEALRFKYKVELSGKTLPPLISQDQGKFSVIIFENLQKFFKFSKYNRRLITSYCRQFNVGIIGFTPIDNHRNSSTNEDLKAKIITSEHLDDYPVNIKNGYQLKDYQVNPSSNVLRIVRPGTVNLGPLTGNDWFIFDVQSNVSSFSPVAQVLTSDFFVETYPGGYRYSSIGKPQVNNSFGYTNSSDFYGNYKKHLLTTVLRDDGSFDGVQKILFGNGFDYWLHRLLFIDSLCFLTGNRLCLPLKRYVQIDIDDIFVGEKGTRMKASDVESLIDFQKKLRLFIQGFQFNVGFSGKYFHRGHSDENEGDDLMLKNAKQFRWFCHTFSHSQAHLTNNLTVIEAELSMNREFAHTNNLPVDSDYIVSPHHSGVYPVHEPLYDAWKKIWNVRASSTEEYPHLKPAHLRRGFVHKGIMIVPRQTCGLYTHTIYIDKYPGGREKLERNIFGGDLFYSFVFNQVNVFMTHQSNYANDRLAQYSFESVLKFVQCWTNLELLSLPPLQMAKKYFQIYPEERDPIWMNPCMDRRHYNIWSPSKSCFQFPRFLILGPQKTGSTALQTFLSMHPSLIANKRSNKTFEEVQFFSGKNYYNGIDWYMDFFPLTDELKKKFNITFMSAANSSVHSQKNNLARIPPAFQEGNLHFFEKSSTYFDGESVPMRVHALLPHAKLVIILVNPAQRAYSWYQHMRAHNLSVALDFSFYEVISLNIGKHKKVNQTVMKKLRDLRNRCLNPGIYAIHFDRWLSYFPPHQITVIDGDELRLNPILVMDKLQSFLKLEPHIDYSEKLRYDAKKGFYCPIHGNTTKCLGKGKGRVYPKMDPMSKKYLHKFFWHHNIVLSKLLNRMRMTLPSWLDLELSSSYHHH